MGEDLALLQIGAGAKARVYGTGENDGSRRSFACRHSVWCLITFRRKLLVEVIKLGAKRSYK
jgi:hypothetical protein